jgi:hypothetical protein
VNHAFVLTNKTEATQKQNIFIVTNWESDVLAIDGFFQSFKCMIHFRSNL